MTEPVAEFLEFQGEVTLAETTADGPKEAAGLALPYGEILNRLHVVTGARKQRFEPLSAKVRDDAIFYYNHDHQVGGMPIGRVLSGENTDKALHLRTRFAKTAKAQEVHALMKPDEDGKAVLKGLSVGYLPVKGHLDETDPENPVYVHDEIDVFEVSVADRQAMAGALVDTVLSNTPIPKKKEKAMTETLEAPVSREDFDALSAALEANTNGLENLDRRIATLGTGDAGDSHPAVPAHSYGEFLQMVAGGSKEALDFLEYVQNDENFLSYTGGVIADQGAWVRDSWVGDIYRPITEKRRLHNLFASSPLPPSGENVEYGRLLADTTDVGEQAAEGDVLDYGKLTFDTATAPVKTYGGWTDMSRRQIDRSGIAVVEQRFQALVNRYAQVTEAALRTVVANVANSHPLVLAGTAQSVLTTADGWIDFLVDASFWLDDKGLQPEFVLVGRDVFKTLAKLRDGDNADAPRLLDRASGTMNVTGLSGEIMNLPVIPVNSAGLVRVGHSSAIRTFEDGRAPFRLQDGDITNLTEAFSIYGYEAIAVQDKNALVSPDVTGA